MSTGPSGYVLALDDAHYSAVSDEAKQVMRALHLIRSDRQPAESLSGRLTEADDRLYAAIEALTVDEEQADVPLGALSNVQRLLRMLPDTLPLPEVGIDPDGAISLDWMPTRFRMFSISVSDSDSLAYAWLHGTDRGHGVVRFVDGLPQWLWSQLAEIVGDADASLRVA